MKKLTVLIFQDPHEQELNEEFVCYTQYSEKELQKFAEEIVNDFAKDGFVDWTYRDILEELENRGLIEYPSDEDVKWITILL